MRNSKENHRTRDREVSLKINGEVVDMNGFVQDVFQEVVVGLVRSLGSENPEGKIEISLGPASDG